MKTRFAVMLLVLATLTVSACSMGSSVVVHQDRDVEDFDRISFTSIGEMEKRG